MKDNINTPQKDLLIAKQSLAGIQAEIKKTEAELILSNHLIEEDEYNTSCIMGLNLKNVGKVLAERTEKSEKILEGQNNLLKKMKQLAKLEKKAKKVVKRSQKLLDLHLKAEQSLIED